MKNIRNARTKRIFQITGKTRRIAYKISMHIGILLATITTFWGNSPSWFIIPVLVLQYMSLLMFCVIAILEKESVDYKISRSEGFKHWLAINVYVITFYVFISVFLVVMLINLVVGKIPVLLAYFYWLVLGAYLASQFIQWSIEDLRKGIQSK